MHYQLRTPAIPARLTHMTIIARTLDVLQLPVWRLLTFILLLQFCTGLHAADDYHDSTSSCHLLDFSALLQQPELQTDSTLPAEQAYRRLLSRFISLHYSKVARDILQGRGDYLDTLNHLIGVDTDINQSCPQLLKEMLLSSPGPGGFTQALLIQRIPSPESPKQSDTPSSSVTTYPAAL